MCIDTIACERGLTTFDARLDDFFETKRMDLRKRRLRAGDHHRPTSEHGKHHLRTPIATHARIQSVTRSHTPRALRVLRVRPRHGCGFHPSNKRSLDRSLDPMRQRERHARADASRASPSRTHVFLLPIARIHRVVPRVRHFRRRVRVRGVAARGREGGFHRRRRAARERARGERGRAS